MRRFADKAFVIAGGTSGIGLVTARRFAAEGARVLIGGRSEEAGRAAAAGIRQAGGRASFKDLDVTRTESVAAFLDAALAEFGRLDGAFNNAGWEGTGRFCAEVDDAEWMKMIDVKLNGCWRCVKAELRHLERQGDGGAIVNMAGNWGLIGFPGYASYCAAAHGVMGLTKAAALEYGKAGIRINAVCPGAVDAPMLDRMVGGSEDVKRQFGDGLALGRIARPDDVAGAVLWLCSDDAAYVSGHGLVLDGGGA